MIQYNLTERSIEWRNEETYLLSLKRNLFLEAFLSGATSQAEVCRRHSLKKINSHSGSDSCLKMRPCCYESTDKQSSDAEKRIAHLEQLVGKMAVALDIQKKLLTGLD